MCMLDASKAFDRVNLLTLFNKLYHKGLCPFYLRLLMILYKEQKMRVRWNTTVGEIFTVSNGVKQGGVLSLLAPFGIGTIVDTEKEVGIKQCDNIQVNKHDMYSESNGDPLRK